MADVSLVRWLRETMSRQVPRWMLYAGVAFALGVLILLQYVVRLGWLQSMVLAMVLAIPVLSVAKLVWAAANPLPDSEDRLDI